MFWTARASPPILLSHLSFGIRLVQICRLLAVVTRRLTDAPAAKSTPRLGDYAGWGIPNLRAVSRSCLRRDGWEHSMAALSLAQPWPISS